MQRILSIVWYKILPANYGGQKGIACFNHFLGLKADLTCLCSEDNSTNDTLTYKLVPGLPASKSQFINPVVKKLILKKITEEKFSYVILEHPYHAWLVNYKEAYRFRLIVHAHNIEFLRMQQRKKWWWPWVKYTEKKAFKKADYILFKTEKDRQTALQVFKIDVAKTIIVPFGINIPSLPSTIPSNREKVRARHQIQDKEKILLFAGTPDYEPNILAIENILNNIIPLLNQQPQFLYKVFICGKQNPETIARLSSCQQIIVTGFVDSIEEYMQAADVMLNPVINGSGIQTKNLDALANGLSVAATEFSAEGLPAYLSPSKLLTAPDNDWQKFVENILLLSNTHNPTPPQFYKDFYWENIISRTLSNVL